MSIQNFIELMKNYQVFCFKKIEINVNKWKIMEINGNHEVS